MNVFDVLDYSNVASFESPEPILSMGLSDNDETISLGMVAGFVSVAQRSKLDTALDDIYNEAEYNKLSEKKKNKFIRPPTTLNLTNVASSNLNPDGETKHSRKKFENKYNRLFRKFEYDKVISMSLSTNIR